MAKKKARRKKRRMPETVHEFPAVRITGYESDISAEISHEVYSPETAFDLDVENPLYDFSTRLELQGIGTYPAERKGHRYEITLLGSDDPGHGLDRKLRDVQEREDEFRAPKYHTYRGRKIPVFREVKGMTILRKVRGENAWDGYFFVPRVLARDALILLQSGRQVYVGMHEVKIGRDRWIRSINLQTTDPAES
ncbi:hypothetical protein [Lentisalinibacter salinarum]|uniref:hypothetical protein n=1 Tax=Lentisalinibacter salinarum TaxID=2992239 RepID=UPI0038698890